MQRRQILAMTALGAGSLLAGCGFRLRGKADYAFGAIYVAPAERDSVNHFVLRMLNQQQAQLVGSAAAADVVLRILQDQPSQSTEVITSSGLAQEVTLGLAVTFDAVDRQGRTLMAPATIRLVRDINYSETYQLSKVAEIQTLYRHMRVEAARQILRRLDAVQAPH